MTRKVGPVKLYVSIDMEGLAGTFDWTQEEGTDRALVRAAMERQLEWMLEGVAASAASTEVDEIVVADSHGKGDSVGYALTAKDDRFHLVSGWPRPAYMMPAFDGDVRLVFLLGYHGGAGTARASMDHTYSSRSVARMALNGKDMTEAELNAAYAGSFGVPVALVTGDEALRAVLAECPVLGRARFVVTKQALGRFAAKHRPMNVVRAETVAAVRAALDEPLPPPYVVDGPYELEVELTSTAKADTVSLMPTVERLDGRTVRLVHEDYGRIFDAISAVTLLASHGRL